MGTGIFLWGKPDGNSIFDKLYRLVWFHFPNGLKWIARKIIGEYGPKALDEGWEYVCFTSNPIVQAFYILIIIPGYMIFVVHGYKHIPNPYLREYHKNLGFLNFLVCLFVWVKASFSDPGTVTPLNVDRLCESGWDDLIFQKSECSTCKLLKPARSKHCSMCNICVNKFDHHCIWIGNCVGSGNHHWFLLFLLFHAMICAYGTCLGAVILYHLMHQRQLWSASFIDPVTGERFAASWWMICKYLFATEGMLVFLLVLCAIMGAALYGFFFWHVYLVLRATTTNEVSKWRYWRAWIKRERKEEANKLIKETKNPYNKGMVRNLLAVAFPDDIHCQPWEDGTTTNTNRDSTPASVTDRSKRSGSKKPDKSSKK